ncbi:MAG: hypothetical protein M1275_02045 [Patescibacteria group bacterium]|nr:hypothetical protein [Patescibacteria group bacterium]
MNFTRHAKSRAKKRNLSKSAIQSASFGRGKYLGGHKYKTSKRSGGKIVSVIYRKTASGGRLAITAWKR